MRTAEQYISSLRKLKTKIYCFGRLINSVVEEPITRPHVNAAAMTYHLAHDPSLENLLTATSHITGKMINRFTHIHQDAGDLVKKVKALRLISRKTGSCFQRCVGWDALNAIYTVTYDIDRQYGTEYHKRMRDYVRYLQDTDDMVAGSMTDPKGDRGLRPGEQKDPDQYVRIIEKNKSGIVIRGAKLHQTGIVNSHEMLIMPPTSLRKGEENYALACAVPVDEKGVVHIFGRQTNDLRKYDRIDQGNVCFGIVGGEAMTVLENVFVPWERVFMCGEVDFAGEMVEKFASYHRQNYGGCKAGVSDIIIGATYASAEMAGVEKSSHVRDKLTEMIHLVETLYACSLACSYEGSPTPCGSYFVDPLLANVCKQNVTRFIYEICRISHDLAGGLPATMPSERDYGHPQIGPVVAKYLTGVDGVDPSTRYRIMRLLENMTGGTALVESMHGAGSPQAQRVMMLRRGELQEKKKLALRLAGVLAPGENKCFLSEEARRGCNCESSDNRTIKD